jgi:ribosomal-protein-serine acetyltransferase
VSTVVTAMFTYPLGDDAALLPRTPALGAAYHELQAANHHRLAAVGWPEDPPTPESTRTLLADSGRNWMEGTELPLAIAIQVDDGWQLVGTAGIRIDRKNRTGDVWYWIDAPFEGRGLMRRTMTVLLDQAFGPLGLDRVTADVEATNKRSRDLATRLGFTEEGVHRQAVFIGGRRCDNVAYGMLANEWRARRDGV